MKFETLKKSMFLIGKSFEKFQAHKDTELLMMWFDVFEDEDDVLFATAVKKLITTFEYQVPTIANLNHALADIKNVEKIEAGDVYDEITNAIRVYGSYRVTEAIESMTPLAKQTVKGLGGFQQLCLSETLMVDRSHCLKIAQQYIERDKKDNLTTNSMKKEQQSLMGDLVKKLSMKDDDED